MNDHQEQSHGPQGMSEAADTASLDDETKKGAAVSENQPCDYLETWLDDHWCIVITVSTDGTLWPWLVYPEGDEPDPAARLQAWPAHELTGPLPSRFQRDLHQRPVACAEPLCGAPTKSGLPCRAMVSAPGARCRHHRARALEESA